MLCSQSGATGDRRDIHHERLCLFHPQILCPQTAASVRPTMQFHHLQNRSPATPVWRSKPCTRATLPCTRATLSCTPSHRMRGAAAPPRATGRARCLTAPTRAPGAGGTRRDSAPAACHIFVFLFRPFLAAHSNPAGRPSRCPEAGFRDSPNPAGDASPWRSLGFSRALPLRRRCLSVSRWSFADTLLFLLSVHPLRPRPVCNAPGEGGWRCC